MFIDVTSPPHNANGLNLDNFAPFLSADVVGTTGGTLYVPRGIYRIAQNLTIAADIYFEQGARLKLDPLVVVTLNGAVHAGAYQIFDVPFEGSTHQPLGNVIPNCVEQLLPQWWGARGDGVADDSPPIQAALAAARNSGVLGSGARGAVVFFLPGVYRITKSLNCTVGQFNLRGSGQYQSVLRG
ncbi:MAG TPA: glycosyl hydrolase family 28-related protein, partial [Longimicrobium sp.]|nr:glycosyl hydrolase family 28-related protein [Longimicrobium sp.]